MGHRRAEDNRGCIGLPKNAESIKQLDIKHHFIKVSISQDQDRCQRLREGVANHPVDTEDRASQKPKF